MNFLRKDQIMAKIYRSAQGNIVDMEKLRLANEEVIAVGNMRVNARGDQLGPGGKIVKTRNQIMKEYYQLNTPVSIPSKPEKTGPSAEIVTSIPQNHTVSVLEQEMADIENDVDDKPKSKFKK